MTTTQKYQKLKKLAIKILKTKAIDAGHDLSHHARVYELAKEIANKENLPYNPDILELASFWHDVPTIAGTTNVKLFSLNAQNLSVDKEIIKKIIYCIENHSFSYRPKSLEARLLYDADKLDALSEERLQNISKAIKTKKISEKRKQLYIKVGKSWLLVMKRRLHFKYSKELYEKRLKLLFKSQRVKKIAKDLHINLQEIQRISGNSGPFYSLISLLISKVIDIRRIILRRG